MGSKHLRYGTRWCDIMQHGVHGETRAAWRKGSKMIMVVRKDSVASLQGGSRVILHQIGKTRRTKTRRDVPNMLPRKFTRGAGQNLRESKSCRESSKGIRTRTRRKLPRQLLEARRPLTPTGSRSQDVPNLFAELPEALTERKRQRRSARTPRTTRRATPDV